MTELEKKAEEYARQNKDICYGCTIHKSCLLNNDSCAEKEGYLIGFKDGAKSRDKEVEELNAQIEKIKKVISCDNCKHNYEHVINMCPYYNCNLEKWELAE